MGEIGSQAADFGGPDPKPPKRIKDPQVAKLLHARGVLCVLCGKRGTLHHIRKHPRHDVPENFVGLCGDGTTGHHGLIEAEDVATRTLLGAYLHEHRFDTIFWLFEQMGEGEAKAWLHRRYFMAL